MNKFVKIPREYIQMRLPVEKISKDFEEMVKIKIQHYPVHAEIRDVTKGDIESILEIYGKAWHSTIMPYHPLSKGKLLRLLKNKNFKILIAKGDATDGAFVIIHITGDRNNIGTIGILAVIPELQHKGLGTF